MSDRRKGPERRKENIDIEEDNRKKKRRSDRRHKLDRRVSVVKVDVERRKGPRRKEEIKKDLLFNKADMPDWIEEAMADAAKRQDEQPSMTPPPVSTKENDYISKSEEERDKESRRGDLFIVVFIIFCFIGVLLVLNI